MTRYDALTHWGRLTHISFQIMACRLLAGNPLSEPMIVYCQLDQKEHISMKFYLKFKSFRSRKCIWKCCPQKWRQSCLGLNVLNAWWRRGTGFPPVVQCHGLTCPAGMSFENVRDVCNGSRPENIYWAPALPPIITPWHGIYKRTYNRHKDHDAIADACVEHVSDLITSTKRIGSWQVEWHRLCRLKRQRE